MENWTHFESESIFSLCSFVWCCVHVCVCVGVLGCVWTCMCMCIRAVQVFYWMASLISLVNWGRVLLNLEFILLDCQFSFEVLQNPLPRVGLQTHLSFNVCSEYMNSNPYVCMVDTSQPTIDFCLNTQWLSIKHQVKVNNYCTCSCPSIFVICKPNYLQKWV